LLQRVRRQELVHDNTVLFLVGAVLEVSARWWLRLVPALWPRGEAQLVPCRGSEAAARVGSPGHREGGSRLVPVDLRGRASELRRVLFIRRSEVHRGLLADGLHRAQK
jgi:hypothetical protein